MPCNSDHLNPTAKERYSKETAELMIYAAWATGTHVPAYVAEAAAKTYGDVDMADDLTNRLCSIVRAMDSTQMRKVLYDGSKPDSRRLAQWWEDHQKADAEREAADAAREEHEVLIPKAQKLAASLTEDEKKVLRAAMKLGLL